ncbi:MAG TPA: hypothetical protein VG225_02165 [Terracidiphilus sp.]|nr:hypothetical protein [Terracidiphilus sp.]
MALTGIYIDDKNQCQPVDENGKNLPDAFAAEMKLYKLCKFAIDGSDDPGKVAKAITAALAKWSADEAANRVALGKAESEADTALAAAKEKNRGQAEKDLKAEDTRHRQEVNRINAVDKDNPGQKAADTRAENERHGTARNDIIKKQNGEDKKAGDAKKAAMEKARDGLTASPKLEVKCSSSDACNKDCEIMTIYPDPADDKKVKSGTAHLEKVSQLSKQHFYFCSCGKK